MPRIQDVLDEEGAGEQMEDEEVAMDHGGDAAMGDEAEYAEEGDEASAAEEAPAGEPGQTPATAEEQEAYERVVLAGSEILYDKATHEKVLGMLKQGADSPAETIAGMATMIMLQLDSPNGPSKGSIPEAVIIPAAIEIAELTAELAQKSGAFDVDPDTLQRAGQLTIEALAENYDVTPEDLQALLAQFDDGTLEQMRAEQDRVANPAAKASPPQREGGRGG